MSPSVTLSFHSVADVQFCPLVGGEGAISKGYYSACLGLLSRNQFNSEVDLES